MDTIVEQKKQLRRIIKLKKSQLSALDCSEKSNLVFSEIEQMPQFIQSSVVLAFWSLPDEVCTHQFVAKWRESKIMLLPVMVGPGLQVRKFTGFDTMSSNNSFGVSEPLTGEMYNPQLVDFAIIPGVAFDTKGNRIGRGKGFYDRLMPQLSKATKVGVGYNFQLVDSVPVAEFDIPVDCVICR